MTTVYRVQDKDGRGPWRPGFSSCWVEDREDHDNLLPYFVEFGRLELTYGKDMNLGVACLTMEQLRRWFTKSEYATLRLHGYQAVKMRVDRVVASSEVQCVFERAKQLHLNVEPVELYG